MPLAREPDAATRERARRLYENSSVSIEDITHMAGLASTTFRRRALAWGWVRGSAMTEPPVPKPPTGLPMTGPAAPEPAFAAPAPDEPTRLDRRTTIERVRCAVDREIFAVEAALSRLGSLTRRVPESERAARTLASLVKTLTELKRLETASDEGEADDGPVDMDELRRDLARRLHGLRESRAD